VTVSAPAAQEVLVFWFGEAGAPDHGAPRKQWFVKDAVFDRQIAERFATLIEGALAGELDGWGSRPDSGLAQIIVLDQFTRNVFRDSPRAFAGDARALAAARAMVAARHDELLPPVRRGFVYMPFEHAEDRLAQAEGVQRFRDLAASAPQMHDSLDWALRHQIVIDRFGRFPHRNAVLGRASTSAELAFLEQPGSRF
jgi:uncharacterized protein (DUF924 family)